MKLKAKILVTVCAMAVASMTQNVNAGAVVGATEFTQIANNFQLLFSYAEQAQQTVHQLNQYNTMLRNLASTTPSSLLNQQAALLWNDQNMTKTFRDLRTLVMNGEKVSYTLQNQDQMFKRLHPGYGSEFSSKNEYQSWSDNTHSSVRNALAVAGAQSESFSSEQDVVRELQLRSQSADGQMKALQAGNDIGVAMVGQMQQLRQLQIAQMTAQNQFMSKDTSVVDEKKKSLGIVFGNLRSSKVTQGAKTVPVDPNQ